MTTQAIFHTPEPKNEPVKSYIKGSVERQELEAELERRLQEVIEIPCVVGGERIYTGRTVEIRMPSRHGQVLAKAHLATPEVVEKAIANCLAAKKQWENLPWQERVAIFLKAASLLEGSWRKRLNATTMLGQAKTCHQAEIDASCELIDFWRFNARYTEEILGEQPQSAAGVWNRLDYRPLEGFIFAITPFNFTSIAINLPSAPAMLGNVALWKPSNTQLYSAWEGYLLMEEAGLPPGIINFLPGNGADVGDIAVAHPEMSGLHFTGSTATFQHLWKKIGENIGNYRTYPRIVGETGGKDFIVAHPSANAIEVGVAILRGAFEFQGQKCSAASRMYIPKSLWNDVRAYLEQEVPKITIGDITDFSNFFSAVIDERSFDKHASYLETAKQSGNIIVGGTCDKSVGWFVHPTVVQVEDPKHVLMSEEIFGPVATIYVYKDQEWEQVLELVDQTSPYALTGAVFSKDRYAIQQALSKLRHSAGNFYVNDKPTGAVVGQQPFGGARGSGTNDKAGAALNLMRWLSPRTIKETFSPPRDWKYVFLD